MEEKEVELDEEYGINNKSRPQISPLQIQKMSEAIEY